MIQNSIMNKIFIEILYFIIEITKVYRLIIFFLKKYEKSNFNTNQSYII